MWWSPIGQPYPPPMATRGVEHGPSVEQAVSLYAAGYFPMDDVTEANNPLPFYAAERRALLELDDASRAALRRRVRRSLRTGDEPTTGGSSATHASTRSSRRARAPASPATGCGSPSACRRLYRRLHEAGLAHSFEIEAADGELAAGLVGVTLGRAAMLESMFHRVPDAGNVLLARTLDELAARGFVLCDIQLPTEHTTRMGARLVAREEYEARLRAALS